MLANQYLSPMPHPKDNEAYPVGSVVRIKKTGQFAVIRDRTFLKDGKGFLNYLANLEDKGDGKLYALYHDDIELEHLPQRE